MALERELEAFQRELPNLLRDEANRGKYVLIHGDEVRGVWPTVDDALEAGYNAFGLDPFLVKEITDAEKPRYFSRSVTRWDS